MQTVTCSIEDSVEKQKAFRELRDRRFEDILYILLPYSEIKATC
jgi:hypothetical protein